MLALVAIGFNVLYREALYSLVTDIIEAIRSSSAVTADSLIDENLEYLKSKHLVIVGTGIFIVTAIFSYLMAKLALAPTKSALASQKQFIGNIAHELRTPLAIVKTNAEVALFSASLSAETRKIFQSTIEELDRASNIINNLLSISTLTSRTKLPFENVDLGDIVDSAIAHLQELADKKGIGIATTRGDERQVWGNASALEQIVTNILKNAIHYSPVGSGAVQISIQPDLTGAIELSIEDSGTGIKKEDLHRILEPFYRTDQSRTRGEAGSGLGLTIVSELLHLHEGRMQIKSAPGRGTKVSITLPPGRVRGTETRSDLFGEISIDFTRPR